MRSESLQEPRGSDPPANTGARARRPQSLLTRVNCSPLEASQQLTLHVYMFLVLIEKFIVFSLWNFLVSLIFSFPYDHILKPLLPAFTPWLLLVSYEDAFHVINVYPQPTYLVYCNLLPAFHNALNHIIVGLSGIHCKELIWVNRPDIWCGSHLFSYAFHGSSAIISS